jgi:hypothetical protein
MVGKGKREGDGGWGGRAKSVICGREGVCGRGHNPLRSKTEHRTPLRPCCVRPSEPISSAKKGQDDAKPRGREDDLELRREGENTKRPHTRNHASERIYRATKRVNRGSQARSVAVAWGGRSPHLECLFCCRHGCCCL